MIIYIANNKKYILGQYVVAHFVQELSTDSRHLHPLARYFSTIIAGNLSASVDQIHHQLLLIHVSRVGHLASKNKTNI